MIDNIFYATLNDFSPNFMRHSESTNGMSLTIANLTVSVEIWRSKKMEAYIIIIQDCQLVLGTKYQNGKNLPNNDNWP
jgi:hypothetical protein